jgi:hypothetical protein
MFSKIFLALMVLTLTFSVNAQVQGDLIQPSASIQITTDSFHSAIDTVRDNWGSICVCKGLMSRSGVTTTNPVVEINLLQDPPDVWVVVAVPVGQPVGYIFRRIRSTNTTCPLDSIVCFPR